MKISNICCIGASNVVGPTMAVIAMKYQDIKVTFGDHNVARIAARNEPLEQLPIYEPGLADVIGEAVGRNFIKNSVSLKNKF